MGVVRVAATSSLLLVTLLSPPAWAANDALCGATLTESYTLTADVDCTGYTGTAITIGADGVTLDGGGHRLIAPDATYAVYAQSWNDVTVRNIDVSGWCQGTGVRVNGATGVTIEHVIADGRTFGVYVSSSDDVAVRDLRTSGASNGLYLTGIGLPLQLEDLTLRDGGTGLSMSQVAGPLTLGPAAITSFGGNDTDLLLSAYVTDLTVSGLRLDGRSYGVSALDATNSGLTFVDLDVSGHHGVGRGIYLGGTNHRIERVIADQRQYGVHTSGVAGLTLIDVRANYTSNTAISLNATEPPLVLRELDVAHGAIGLQVNGYTAPAGSPLTIDAYDGGTDSGVLVDTSETNTALQLQAAENIVVGNAIGDPPLRLHGDDYGLYAYSTTNVNLTVQNVDARGRSGNGTGLYVRCAGVEIDDVDVSDRSVGAEVDTASDVSIRALTADNCGSQGLLLENVAPPVALEELRLTRNKTGLVFTSFDGEHVVPESDPPELAPLLVDPWIAGVGGAIADLSGNATSIDINATRNIRFEGLRLDGRTMGFDGNIDTNADIELVDVDTSGPGVGTGVLLRGPGHRLSGVTANDRTTGIYVLRGSGLDVASVVANRCTTGLQLTHLTPSHAAPTLGTLELRDNDTALLLQQVTRPWTVDGLTTALDVTGSWTGVSISSSTDITLKNLSLPTTGGSGVLASTGNARLAFDTLDVSGFGLGVGLHVGGHDAELTGIIADHRATGVRVSDASGLEITNLRARHNADYGLRLDATDDVVGYVTPSLAGLTLTDNAVGLLIYQWKLPLTLDGDVATLGLDVSGSGTGVSLQYVQNVTLKNLTLDNPDYGVDAPYPAENLTFEGLDVSGHGDGTGIRLGSNTVSSGSAGPGHEVRGVTADARHIGVVVNAADNVVIDDLTATGCNHSGLYITGLEAGEAPSLRKLSLGNNERGLYLDDVVGESGAPIVIGPYDPIGETGVIVDLAGCNWGVELMETSWVEVRDLDIDAYTYGVYAASAANHHLTFAGLDVTGASQGGYGLSLSGTDISVRDVVVARRATGVVAAGVVDLEVDGLVATTCSYGLDIDEPEGTLALSDLTLERCNTGLRVDTPSGPLELGPDEITSLRGSNTGINVSYADALRIHDLDLSGQLRATGINLATTTGARIEHVDVSGHGQGTGINAGAATDLTLLDVTADGRFYGVYLSNATNPTLTDVRARRCSVGVQLFPLTLPLTLSGLDVSDDVQGLHLQSVSGAPSLTLGPTHLTAWDHTQYPIWEDGAAIDVDLVGLSLSPPVGSSYPPEPALGPNEGPDPDCGADLDGVTDPLGTALTLDAGTGTYTLVAPLDCHLLTGGPALEIVADGVTLDGGDLYVDAPYATAAVLVNDVGDVELRDLDVSGLARVGHGVTVTAGGDVTLTNVTADHRQYGVVATGTAGIDITGLTARGTSTAGLSLDGVTDPTLGGLVLTDGDGAGLRLKDLDGDPLDTGASYVLGPAAFADLRGNDYGIHFVSGVTDVTLTGASEVAPLLLDGDEYGLEASDATNARLTLRWLDVSGRGGGTGILLGGVDHTVLHVDANDRATGVETGGAAPVSGLHLEDVTARFAVTTGISLSGVALPLELVDLSLVGCRTALSVDTFDGADPDTGEPLVIDATALADLTGSLTSVRLRDTSHVALLGYPPGARLVLPGRDDGLDAVGTGNHHVTVAGVDASAAFPIGTGISLAGDANTLDDVVVRARDTGVSVANGAGVTLEDVTVSGVTTDGVSLSGLTTPTVERLDISHTASCLKLTGMNEPVTAAPGGGRLLFDTGAITALDGCDYGVSVTGSSNLGFVGFASRGGYGIDANDVNNRDLRFEDLDLSGIWHEGYGLRLRGDDHALLRVDVSDRATGLYLNQTNDVSVTGCTMTAVTNGNTSSGNGLYIARSTGLELSGNTVTHCSVGLNILNMAGTAAEPIELGATAFAQLGDNIADIALSNVDHLDISGLTLSGWNYGVNASATTNSYVTFDGVNASGPGGGTGIYLGGAGHSFTGVTANDRSTGVYLVSADGVEITGLTARRAQSVGLYLYGYDASFAAPTLTGLVLTDDVVGLRLYGWARPTVFDGAGASPSLGITTAGNATDVQLTSTTDVTLSNLAFDGETAGINANHASNARLTFDALELSGPRIGDGLTVAGADAEVSGVTAHGRRYGVDTYNAAGLELSDVTVSGATWCLLLRNVNGGAPATLDGLDCTASGGALYITSYQPDPPLTLTAASGVVTADIDTGAYLIAPCAPIRFEDLDLNGRDYGVQTSGDIDLTLDGVDVSGDGFGTGVAAGGAAVRLVDVVAHDRATGASLTAALVDVDGFTAARASTTALSIGPTTTPTLAGLSLTDSAVGLTLTSVEGPLTVDPAVVTSLADDKTGVSVASSRAITVSGLTLPHPGYGLTAANQNNRDLVFRDLDVSGSCVGTGLTFAGEGILAQRVIAGRRTNAFQIGAGDAFVIEDSVAGASGYGIHAASNSLRLDATVVSYGGNSATYFRVDQHTTSTVSVEEGETIRVSLDTGDEDVTVLARSSYYLTVTPALSKTPEVGTVVRALDAGEPRLVLRRSDICANGTGFYSNALPMTAVDNYWRSSTGPTHASVPGGTGDLVTADDTSLSPFDTVPSDKANPYCNQAPLPDAGAPQTVCEGDTVHLDATGSSDPDEEPLTYAWGQLEGSSATLTGADTGQPSFVAPTPATAPETLTFEVAVADDQLARLAQVEITVEQGNPLPTAVAGAHQQVDEGEAVTLSAAGSFDPDGSALTYAWVQTSGPAVTLTGADTDAPTFTAPDVGPGGGPLTETLTFQLTVTDVAPPGYCGGDKSAGDTVNVDVDNVPHGPVAEAGGAQDVDEGTLVTLDGSASADPDGDVLSFSWVQTGGTSVTLTGATTAAPTFSAPEQGELASETLTFEVTVDDGFGGVASDTVTVTVNDVCPDSDGDGVIDCLESCDDDPLKLEPGLCGCGVADDDGDGDGAPDCVDGCPLDGNKTEPGQCGCGALDTDSDGNGIADCAEDCEGRPDGTVISSDAPCGVDACGETTGQVVCQGGVAVTTCDPAYPLVPDTTCDVADVVAVAYAIVYDGAGAPRGTIRCARDAADAIACDEEEGAPGRLRVYDGLFCPGVTP